MRPRLTYANVTATIALIIAVGGASAFAATQLTKNSVGSKQLKKNAVTTPKVKKEAITAAKVKKGTLTGTQISTATLGTVPNAAHSGTADTANAISPPEPWHLIGGPGEPAFLNKWHNAGSPTGENAGFYKDHEGIVHLKGFVKAGTEAVMFQLPSGDRPASGKTLQFSVYCEGGFCTSPQEATVVRVFGAGANPETSGAVAAPNTTVSLDGISFRAES
jgi:hypothetical protein